MGFQATKLTHLNRADVAGLFRDVPGCKRIASGTHQHLARHPCGTRRRMQYNAAAAPPAQAASQTSGSNAVRTEPVYQNQPASFNWSAHWYPVGFVRDFSLDKPHQFMLLGQDLCLFYSKRENTWAATANCCPHRLVPLSEGRISTAGNLQCAYHGWEFAANGSCLAIPQGGNPNNKRACVTAFETAVRQGLLWVKLQPCTNGQQPDTSSIPILPEIDEGWIVSQTFRDLPYDGTTLLENLLDVGHVPFTHHASVSKRSTADVMPLRIVERTPTGFIGRNDKGPRKGQLGAQDTIFQAPVLMRHTIDAYKTKGFSNITAVYCVPMSPGRCRAIVRNVFNFKSKLPRLAFKVMPEVFTHVGNNLVLEDDQIFLHQQEHLAHEHGRGTKPVAQVYHMPGTSDLYVSELHKWLSQQAGGGPFGHQPPGARLSREELLDRYSSHTEHCAVCQAALRRAALAELAAKWLARLVAAWSATSAAVALSGGTAMTTAGLQASGLAQIGAAVLRGVLKLVPAEPSAQMTGALAGGVIFLMLTATRLQLARFVQQLHAGNPVPPRNSKLPTDEAYKG